MRRLTLLIALVIGSAATADGQLPEVFQIRAKECAFPPTARVQTGFLLSGRGGVLTALHGVLDCELIFAESGKAVFADLTIAEVDVSNDVVVLRSAQLTASGLPGLPRGDVPEAHSKLWIIGHPQAVPGQHEIELTLESAHKLLDELIPDGTAKAAVLQRGSPSINSFVLSLQGPIQPGHSGAPILDSNRRVVGIGNGGLAGGTVDIGWGIPLQELDLRPASDTALQVQLARIRRHDAALAFALSEEGASRISEPGIWSSGTACLTPGSTFDLDRGRVNAGAEMADLVYRNVDGVERYLTNGNGSAFAAAGTADLEAMPFAQALSASYGPASLDASWGGGVVLPGTSWRVRTSEGRHAKLRILRDGQFLQFEWATYAGPGEGSLPSTTESCPCRIEEELACDEGRMAGDGITAFRVQRLQPAEAMLDVDLSYDRVHGPVYIVAILLDRNGENISGGYRITPAQQGTTLVPVMYGRPRPGQSSELLIYLFESGRPGQAFLCRRFPWSMYWGS